MVMFPVYDTFTAIYGNCLTENQRLKWLKSKVFTAYQQILLNGDDVPWSAPSYRFRELHHCGKNTILFTFADNLMEAMDLQKQFVSPSGR